MYQMPDGAEPNLPTIELYYTFNICLHGFCYLQDCYTLPRQGSNGSTALRGTEFQLHVEARVRAHPLTQTPTLYTVNPRHYILLL